MRMFSVTIMEVGENRVRVFYGTEKREGERLEIYIGGIGPCSSTVYLTFNNIMYICNIFRRTNSELLYQIMIFFFFNSKLICKKRFNLVIPFWHYSEIRSVLVPTCFNTLPSILASLHSPEVEGYTDPYPTHTDLVMA